VAKSFFVGEDFDDTADDPMFYARAVVTDVGYGAAQDGLFTSTYAQPPAVIKWEVTEDLLVGRIAYQRIENADEHGTGATDNDGQVAYAFPILSHFDIRRDYNPTTGEETNVIVENTSDRAWNEREYMRVDWSRNLNTDAYDFDTLSQMGVFGGISYEPLSYYVSDMNHPDAPHFAFNEGYFDVTTKAFATPGQIDLSSFGWGINSYPACYLPNDVLGGSYPFGNCNPVELTLRLSFMRVEASDYEPVDWYGKKFTAIGPFTTERFGYARNYGIVDDQWHRFASRYNIWEKSHAYKEEADGCPSGWVASTDFPGQCEHPCYTAETTPPGMDPNRDFGDKLNSWESATSDPYKISGNGTADECEDVGAGSQCDPYKQKCTMPYAERTPKPIVWHYTKDSAQGYFEGTEWATHEWDVAMRTAVRFSQYGECMAVQSAAGTDAASAQAKCIGKFPVYLGQQEENEDAVNLAREVDECRAAIGKWADDVSGDPWSADRVSACSDQADKIGKARGYSAGVISIAKMDEMVTLCHSPVIASDSPQCIADFQRRMSDDQKAKDPRAVLPSDITPEQCETQWDLRYNDPSKLDDRILEACDNGFYARIGDLRYHQINVVRTPQTPSPWGIMVDADDPRTGEKIHASINIWSHVTDLASQGHVDMMRYIKGELKTEDVTDGVYVRDWARAAEASGGRGALSTMDRATVKSREFAAVDGRNFKRASAVDAQDAARKLGPDVVKQARTMAKKFMASVKADPTVKSHNAPYVEARRLAAQNTPTEAALVNEPMMQLAGFNQKEIDAAQSDISAGNFGSPTLASASILRGLNPTVRRELRTARELAIAARGACILEADSVMSPTPNTLASMADVMERKFGAFNPSASKDEQLAHAERIRNYIKQRYQYGVIIHEMGHSIGERHNFVGSYFAYGFRPQYWQLRTNDGSLTTQCDDASADGEDCVGPRYFDPPTQNEKDNLIWMWEQSTVMDYPGELGQDMLGLGTYDFAAARIFYGNTVAVHTGDDFVVRTGKNSNTILNISDNFGGIVGYQYINKGGDDLHYTALQEQLNLISDCKPVDPTSFKPKNWNEEAYGTWDPLVDGLIVGKGDTYTRCKSPQVDYMPYERLREAVASSTSSKDEVRDATFYGQGRTVDAYGRLRVPYGFATDSWADTGNLSVFRHDNGADPYELFNFFITEQETRHIFDNYRRQRTSFSIRTQAERILGRYNEKMRDAAKGLGLQANFFRSIYPELGYDFDDIWPAVAGLLFKDNLVAGGIAFDHFTRQFARPEAGGHFAMDAWTAPIGATGLTAQDRVWRSSQSFSGPAEEDSDFFVYDGATGLFGMVAYGGKLVETRLSDNNGEYDRDYTQNAGSYYDKVYAPYLLTESVDNFISDSLIDFVDPRYRSVSMADLFPDGYRRFLANMLTGEDYLKGARIAANTPGNPSSRATPILDDDKYPSMGIGWTTWWTPSPEVCFPSEGSIVCSEYGCDAGSVCDVNAQTLNSTPHALNPQAPNNTTVLEPQVGWEEWKFLIAQTLIYLPENAKTEWIDMLGLWEIGADTDPGFDNRIELHLPDGRTYIAKTYGTEEIFGRTVQRGVAARVLEYANDLLRNAYECTEVTAPDGSASWCEPTIANGEPIIKADPGVSGLGGGGAPTCTSNRACVALRNYQSLPAFIRQSLHDFRMADASMKGIYD